MRQDQLQYLDSFLNFLTIERNYSQHTVRAYKKDLSEFLEYISGPEFDFTDYRNIRRYFLFLKQKGNQNSTISRKASSIRSFYKYLNRTGKKKSNLFALIEAPKKEKKLPHVLNLSFMNSLMVLGGDDEAGMRDRAVIQLLFATGIRVGELAGLSIEDVNFTRKEIKVLGKGLKERILPVAEQALDSLGDYLNTRQTLIQNSPLFCKKSGDRISTDCVRRIIKKWAKHFGLSDGVSPHTLRHTFATRILEAGADLRSVQELLGHVDLTTTQMYTHLNKQKLKSVYNTTHPRAR